MKTTKLVIITIIIVAFGMAANAFGQPGKNRRTSKPKNGKASFSDLSYMSRNKPHSNTRKRKHKNAKVHFQDFHFGSYERHKPRKHKSNSTSRKTYLTYDLKNVIITSRRKPRKH